MIAIAREKAERSGVHNVRFEVAAVDDLVDTPDRCDVILAHSILHLLADVPDTLNSLAGKLTGDGLLITSIPCIGDTAAWLGWLAPVGRAIGLLPRITLFTQERILAWLDEAGFEIVEQWQPGRNDSVYVVARRVG